MTVSKSLLNDIERTLFYHHHGTVGENELEKARDALIKCFIPEYDTRGIRGFEGLREAYVYLTGDSEIRGRVGFNPSKVTSGVRSCADFDSSTFSFALENALNMYLSKNYSSYPYHEEILISEKKGIEDFKKIHSIQLEYPKDLPDVDPETGDYQSLDDYVDSESQYDIGQKGGITWVTRKHIINDSIGLIKAMIDRRARSARRTHARFVWDFFINNLNCPDGTAWFTGGHGNLGSLALDFSPLVTAIKALANMTEPGSGEKIGMDLATFKWFLVVPIGMWDQAVGINQTECYYTSNDLTARTQNPCYRLFGDHNERIVTCPFLTEANDWGIIRDVGDVPIVEMSYLNWREEPEFLISSGNLDEMNFHGDDYGYKIRHEYGGALVDYRGGYKAIVA